MLPVRAMILDCRSDCNFSPISIVFLFSHLKTIQTPWSTYKQPPSCCLLLQSYPSVHTHLCLSVPAKLNFFQCHRIWKLCHSKALGWGVWNTGLSLSPGQFLFFLYSQFRHDFLLDCLLSVRSASFSVNDWHFNLCVSEKTYQMFYDHKLAYFPIRTVLIGQRLLNLCWMNEWMNDR